MKKIVLKTTYKKMLSDIYTPVGIYLRLRDRFRDTVLLESTDNHAAENSTSIIGINAIGGIEIIDTESIELKYPNRNPEKIAIKNRRDVPKILWQYMQGYEVAFAENKFAVFAQGFLGYTAYNAVQFFDTIDFKNEGKPQETDIPLIRYRLYQYVIVINHFKNEMYLCENTIEGLNSDLPLVESLIKSKDVPVFPFNTKGEEISNLTDAQHLEMIDKGIKSCLRGDVFQIVLGRRFKQKFTGDDFNVYRTLRSINPSPYLFYFDYGDYRLIGSSPESQLIIKNGMAVVHPIAGTFRRTGDDKRDKELAEKLLTDPKENAEHTMLVDLARNDLSRSCSNVKVDYYKQVHYYSHVLHLVSEVSGKVEKGTNPFVLLADTFPAGTLSGAPKFKAMQLINEYENDSRGYYAGCIGFVGFDGSCNQAIMIRTFLSKQNTLHYRAGGGIVAASVPESELQEVHNKLGALKQAVSFASKL
ncbi:MAG: anthranilate synthase component I family protein [Chitinophagaceae bacterium]|jgi:anthranilate synthase component 1|nr:anthranilate synthase component I family protein [Chitinophagaceae bacterium]